MKKPNYNSWHRKAFLLTPSIFSAFIVCTSYSEAFAAVCSVPVGNVTITGTCENAFAGSDAAYNNGSLTNMGTINQTGGSNAVRINYINPGFTQYSLYNYGTISSTSPQALVADETGGLIRYFNFYNYGSITTTDNLWQSIVIEPYIVANITNAAGASISATGINSAGIAIRGTATSIINNGTISALTAISMQGGGGQGNVTNIINTGTLSSTTPAGNALRLDANTTLGTLTNAGTMTNSDNSRGIQNNGTITTINNQQGVGNSAGALKLNGNLPSNYNVMISGSNYGQMSVTSPNGSTTFGVYQQGLDTRTLQQGTVYNSVLAGVGAANLNNTTGKVGDRGTFTLRQSGANTWDMTIDGLWTPIIGYMNPNISNTYAALSSNRDAVSGALHQRYAVLNAVMEYDCNRFDKYGVCLSFQARATGWGDQTTGAGVFNIAKSITEKVRAGVYLDYQAAQATPFATNGYSGGIQWGYNNPTFGGYVGWSDKTDGTGIQARVSGGYNPGKITITRAMLDYAEPGTGTAGLNAYYAYGIAGYGVNVGNGIVITPYGGLRYTDVTRNSYTENFNISSVIFPLGYNAYYEQLITGITGGKVQAMLSEKLGVNIALGGEFDFSRNANSYSGYSYAPGMQVWGIEHGGSWNGVRPAGIVGAFYDVNKNDRLMINAYVGEQAWSSRAYTTLLAGYQLAF